MLPDESSREAWLEELIELETMVNAINVHQVLARSVAPPWVVPSFSESRASTDCSAFVTHARLPGMAATAATPERCRSVPAHHGWCAAP